MKSTTLTFSLIFTLSGCASIMTSDEQSIEVITTNGKAVDVNIDGNSIKTPGSIRVVRDGRNKVLRTTEQDCDSATIVNKSVTPVFFGNIIFGGLLGSTTDSSTGKMWDYEEKVTIQCSN